MLIDLTWSLAVPVFAVLGYGWIQRWLPKENTPLKLALGSIFAISLLQFIAMTLCFIGLLNREAATIGIAGLAIALILGFKSSPKPSIRWIGIAFALIPIILLALPPPWMRDSLTYHLALPKLYALNEGYIETDQIIFQHFPLGWQTLLSLVFCFGEDGDPLFNPRLVAVWLSGFSILATIGICMKLGAAKATSIWAGLTLATIPTFIEFSSSCYAMSWLLLLTSGVMAGGIVKGKKGVIIAGFCIGVACSVKLSGLFLIPLSIALFWQNRGLWPTLALIAICIGSPFYIRNAIAHGNPVFPLYVDWLGGEGWSSWQAFAYDYTLKAYGMGRDGIDWILLPFRLLASHRLEPHDFEGSLGPSLTCCLLFILVASAKKENKRRIPLIIVILGWFILWAIQVQQIRFFMPIVPLILALGFASLPLNSMRNKMAIMVAVVLSFCWAGPYYKTYWDRQNTGRWLRGELKEDEFLYKQLPTTHLATKAMNEMNISTVWLVWMKGYVYHLEKPFKVDSVMGSYRFEKTLDEAKSANEFLQVLKGSGVSHVAINHSLFLLDDEADTDASGQYSPGRTQRLRERFQLLVHNNTLIEDGYYWPVIIYRVQSTD